MRGKRVKQIRKSVYGDMSIRDTKYRWKDGKWSQRGLYGIVVCIGLRKQYKEMKKLYKRGGGVGI